MRATFALIRFELERQWLAVAFALGIGLVAVSLPYFPGSPSLVPAHELRTVASGVSVVAYIVLLALALGASLLARDVAERRASFLFARPISAFSIAIGRLLAAEVLLAISTLLIVAPVILIGDIPELPMPRHEMVEGTGALLAWLGLALVALLVVSSVVLAARARTPWIVLELSAMIVCSLLLLRAFHLLRMFFLEEAPRQLALSLVAAAPLVLAALYLAPFVWGRTDLARAHRAQALAVAALLPTIGAAALAWSVGYLHPSVGEIVDGALFAEPLGENRFALVGAAPSRPALMASVLLDGDRGISLLASRTAGEQTLGPLVVRTGAALYWSDLDGEQFRLSRVALAADAWQPEPTGVVFDRFPSVWAVSTDGRLFVGIETIDRESSRAVMMDVASGATLASRRFPVAFHWNFRIGPEGDGFRLLVRLPGLAIQSWRIDANGDLAQTALGPYAEDDQFWYLDEERSRLFVRQRKPEQWLVLDAKTLLPQFRVRPALADRAKTTLGFHLALLADGSVAVSVRDAGRREITTYAPSGEIASVVSWSGPGVARPVGIGRERALLVATNEARTGNEASSPERAAGWIVRRIDLAGGPEREVARDLAPIRSIFVSRPGPALLKDDAGRLYALDADTGELRKLAID